MASVHRTAASQFARDLVNMQQGIVEGGGRKCRQTNSIGSDGDELPVARVHRTFASQFARDLVNIQQSIVEEGGVENVGKRTPSDSVT